LVKNSLNPDVDGDYYANEIVIIARFINLIGIKCIMENKFHKIKSIIIFLILLLVYVGIINIIGISMNGNITQYTYSDGGGCTASIPPHCFNGKIKITLLNIYHPFIILFLYYLALKITPFIEKRS